MSSCKPVGFNKRTLVTFNNKQIETLMKIPKFNFRAIVSLMALLVVTTTSCKKDKDEKTAPEVPPQSAFIMDFGSFSDAGDTLKSTGVADSYSNWGFSYLNVAVWNTVITVGLAVPVASYVEAFNHEAVYHPDENNWTWSYNFNAGFAVYEAELTGAIEGTQVEWAMRITKSGSYSDFLWYHGSSALNLTSGYWILAESPENPVDLLRIDWNNFSNGTADIRYTNIKTGNPENGSNIWYGTALTAYDRFYNIYINSTDNTTNIEWNSVNRTGHVKDQLHFGDQNWHCWDENLMNVVCP